MSDRSDGPPVRTGARDPGTRGLTWERSEMPEPSVRSTQPIRLEERSTAPSPAPTLVAAMRRYPVLVLLPIVVLAAAGVTLGLRRSPMYSSSSQINVGALNVSAQAEPGYATAAQTLASEYSRLATSQQIAAPVGRRLHLSTAAVSSRLSSAAVPTSPTFSINGTGTTPDMARGLVNAATAALQHRISGIERSGGSTQQLLDRYRTLQQQANQLSEKSGRLKGLRASGTQSVPQSELDSLRLDSQVAALQAQAVASQYQASATSPSGAAITVLNPALGVTSDRRSVTERYGLIGALAGLVVGVVFASMVASLQRLRRRRRAA